MLQSLRRIGARFACSSFLGITALLSGLTTSATAQGTAPPNIENPFPKMPEGVVPLFDLRDTRALDMLQYMNCMNTTVAAARQGVMGDVPDDALLVCVREPREWRGVAGMLSADRNEFRIVAQLALRGTVTRTTEKVDTATAAAVARAMVRSASTPTRSTRYSFTAIPLKLPTFVEVWFMPVQNSATKMYVGGDSLIQMTIDGRREQGHFSTSPAVRELAMPGGQGFVIESVEDEIPLVSELLAARLALTRVHEVRIRTKRFESVISNTTRKWTHTPRRS